MAFGIASLKCGFTFCPVEGPRASQHSVGETWKATEQEPGGILGSLSALEEKGLQCVERLLNWGKCSLALTCAAGGHADEALAVCVMAFVLEGAAQLCWRRRFALGERRDPNEWHMWSGWELLGRSPSKGDRPKPRLSPGGPVPGY